MVGTDTRTRGGIATVVRGYRTAGLFARMPVHYVVTHVDGGRAAKARVAAAAYSRVITSLMRLEEPLVHIHLSSRASFWRKSLVCEMAVVAQRPYLLHVHGSEFMEFYRDECGRAARKYVQWILGRASLLLALSEQWRDRLLEIQPLATVEVLPNAVPIHVVADKLERSAHSRTVLFAGRIGRRKGTFELLDAFVEIAARFPNVRLVCAGDGDIAAARGHATKNGLIDRVDFPGWLSPADMQRELAAATLFVLPSHAEGLPMAVLEAMSFGIPVVATPVGGIPGVIVDGVNGLLVPPGEAGSLTEAVSALLSDAELAQRIGRAGRATIVRNYSLEAAVEQLCSLYQRFGVSPNPAQ